MQVFKYDPAAGNKGDKIADVKRISWTDQSVAYQAENGIIEPIEFALPEDTKNSHWEAHVDAGYDTESYLSDEWICFCQGEMVCGQGAGVWEWIVLPPKSLIERI